MSSKSAQLKKQNDGMYANLVKNNVPFERKNPSPDSESEEELLKFYLEEKKQLVQALQEFKKSQPKQEKVSVPKAEQPKTNPKKEEKQDKDKQEKDADDEETFVEKKKTYPTFNNMEELKRSFCNGEKDNFLKLCREQKYLFFEGNYKHAGDMNGKADYVAKNLVTGFVRNLEDRRNYFFNCYRCYANTNANTNSDADANTYSYTSLWIVNTDSDLTEVTEGCVDDFVLTKVEPGDLDRFLEQFQKSEESNLLKETYLH